MKLPAETIQVFTFNSETKQREPRPLTLDAGRMPTVRGRAGTVADRSATVNVMKDPTKVCLFAVYMLAHLRCPESGEAERWVLVLTDLEFYRQFEDMKRGHLARQPGRYYIELWQAALEQGDSGNPDQDASWEMLNPEMNFAVPLGFTLQEARLMTETLARLLAQGRAHPLRQWPSPEKVKRERDKRIQAGAPTYQRLLQTDAALAAVWNRRKGEQLNRWKWRGPQRYGRAIVQAMLDAVCQQRRARYQAQQAQVQRRHLSRALERGGEYQLKRDQPWQFASYTMTSRPLDLIG